MGDISVAEAARRLGVGVPRVHQRIADGSLPATRVGSQWVIDEASLAPAAESHAPGRPLSHRSAWALLALSQSDQDALDALAPAERSRARERLQRLLAQSPPGARPSEVEAQAAAALLRSWFRNRAERRLYRASPRDLPDMRDDHRLTLTGLSHPRSGIAAGDLVEGYLAAEYVDDVVADHLLSTPAADRDANVVLHVAAAAPGPMAPLLLAADLAEHRRPREEARAAELLREIAAERRPSL